MIEPLISIIIPSYNHGHFISRALQSLIDQSYSNWEAIVVDNHSVDSTEYVVSKFADPRINLLKIHNNGIIAASRNVGITAAKGDWIAFLDSDDWWVSDKLKLCFRWMEEGEDLIYHDLRVVRQTPSVFERDTAKARQLRKPVFMDLLLNDNTISNSSVVVRKKFLQEIGGLDENPDMAGAEDFNAWLRIACLTDRFKYIPMFLGFYQVHDQGISRKDMSVCYKYAIAEFITLLSEKQKELVEGMLAYMRGKHHFQNKRLNEATIHLKLALTIGGAGIKIKAFFAIALIFWSKCF